MKITKSNIIYTVIFIAIFCVDLFVMKPYVDEKYLYRDLWDFELDSLQYTIISAFIICLSLILYRVISSIKLNKKSIPVYIILLIQTVFFILVFDSLIERSALYFNTLFIKENLKKEYVLQKHKDNKAFILFDNKNEIITGIRTLERIDLERKSKKLKSIYKLNNNDTIIINYKIGFLKTKFLE